VLGVVSAPMLSRRCGRPAAAAFANGEPIAVSEVGTLDGTLLCHADLRSYERYNCGPEFGALTRRVWDRRGFGDFWGHMLVAEGIADVMVEPILDIWDVAALIPIVQEAGGRTTDRRGAVRADGGNAVTTNGVLHGAVLEIVGERVNGAAGHRGDRHRHVVREGDRGRRRRRGRGPSAARTRSAFRAPAGSSTARRPRGAQARARRSPPSKPRSRATGSAA
jgi:hypothetical protein